MLINKEELIGLFKEEIEYQKEQGFYETEIDGLEYGLHLIERFKSSWIPTSKDSRMIVEGLKKYCENCPKASLYIESDILYANGKPDLITHALHCKNEELCEQIRKELIKEFKEKWEVNNVKNRTRA